MAKAEGRIFSFKSEKEIKTSLLESFKYNGEKQLITYSTKEFSPVCPFSGLPDFGELIIEYIPKKLCVELKSLKYYLVSYRNIGIYQEAATNKIFQDLKKCLKPSYLKITTLYNARGGIIAKCEIETIKECVTK
jgi:7-cyano-7-deazaguanine reductase